MKLKPSRDFFRRAGWLFLVALFVITGLGVGIVGFWQSTHQQDSQTQTQDLTANSSKGKKLDGWPPVAKIEALSTSDLTPGDGTEVKVGSTITVHYTGALASTGEIFQSSLDSGQPLTTELKKR